MFLQDLKEAAPESHLESCKNNLISFRTTGAEGKRGLSQVKEDSLTPPASLRRLPRLTWILCFSIMSNSERQGSSTWAKATERTPAKVPESLGCDCSFPIENSKLFLVPRSRSFGPLGEINNQEGFFYLLCSQKKSKQLVGEAAIFGCLGCLGASEQVRREREKISCSDTEGEAQMSL